MSFTLVTDTSANLPTPYVKKQNITVIPLSLTIEGKEFECLDTTTYDYENYYSKIIDGMNVKTSQINPQKYMDFMEPILESGQDILFIGMSSGISGSFASATIAKEQLAEEYPERKIELVDSLAASLGEGRLVQKALAHKNAGLSLEETVKKLEKEKKHIYQVFTVNDLMYLRKGGRLSNATAIIGTILNIKPLLKGNEEGKIVTYAKTRGRKAVLKHLVQKYERLVVQPETQCIGISHCNCLEDANMLADMLRETKAPKEIQIVAHEPITGSYLGPGALALYFDGDESVRTR